MYKLKYNKIPTEWINGLPISNGRLAAMYWGDGKRDIISLNHERLWSAEYKGKEPDISYDKLPILRDLLEKRDYFRATLFANLFFGGFGGDCTVAPGRIDSFPWLSRLTVLPPSWTESKAHWKTLPRAVPYMI